MVPDDGPLHGVEQIGPPFAVLAGLGVLVQGDARPIGQEPYGVDEVQVLGGPHERDGVTRGLAAEAVVEALLGIDAERGALLGVERAEPGPSAPDPLQRGMFADERHDVGRGPHLGHVLVGYAHLLTVPRRCARRVWPGGRRGQLALEALLLGRAGLGRAGLGRAGLGRAGLGRPGLGRPGLGRAGLGRAGLGRAGLGRDRRLGREGPLVAGSAAARPGRRPTGPRGPGEQLT